MAALFACVVASAALARAPTDTAAMERKLTRVLGINWTVRAEGSTVEVYRTPRQLPIEGFDGKLDAAVRSLHHRQKAATADFAEGTVHLASTATDCDDVVEAARRFATIRGVNAVVIDTDCSPRQ